ncbi:MAG: PTS sugar transporter subunit IIB [Erysipelotrichaceae bacterium]
MKNIILLCAAGMSTSLLVTKMQNAAKERGLEYHIEAFAINEDKRASEIADVILLGPQVRFQVKKMQEKYPELPIDSIDMRDYGTMNGSNVLDFARKLMGED